MNELNNPPPISIVCTLFGASNCPAIKSKGLPKYVWEALSTSFIRCPCNGSLDIA